MFSSQDPVLSYIEMQDSIKSNLTQFTFTAWFKFIIGIKKYNLLSYRTTDETGVINVQFRAESKSVTNFIGQILKRSERLVSKLLMFKMLFVRSDFCNFSFSARLISISIAHLSSA